jgi:hypothetical protein
MSVSREPAPNELLAYFEAMELSISEVLLNSFLENHNIDPVQTGEVFEKGSAPPASKPPDVPEETTH